MVWVGFEWILSRIWVDFEWILNRFWVDFEWILWVNIATQILLKLTSTVAPGPQTPPLMPLWLKPPWNPLEASLKPPKPPSCPLQAPFSPPSSPLQAPPLQAPKPPSCPSSPLQAPFNPPSSPLQAPPQASFTLKPPWIPLANQGPVEGPDSEQMKASISRVAPKHKATQHARVAGGLPN